MSFKLDLDDMLPLGEKWKIVNQFVARVKENEINSILEECKEQPSSLFNLIKFSLADKFHRFDLMTELLLVDLDDKAMLNGILSKRWLYEGDNNSLTNSAYLLDELFPNVSLICRKKILYKIGRCVRNEGKANQLWKDVEQRYGFDAAFPLLLACSKNVITSVVYSKKVKLSGYAVVQLMQKYPDVGLWYFKNHKVECSKMNPQCSPLHYLYKNRLDDFLNLCIEQPHKFRDFKIGRHRSTKMIRAHRASLLEHPKTTTALLKLDRIQREFSSEEFQTFYESTLPEEAHPIGNINKSWKWVCTVPLYRQVTMVTQAYRNRYGINFDEYPKYMNDEYIFLLPEEQRLSVYEQIIANMEKEPRYNWSLKGFNESCYDSDKTHLLLPLKPISHSAPELKKLLLIEQDVGKRATLSKYLLQTCYINEDLPELLNVFKLLSKRSRNDQPAVRKQIFNTLAFIMKKMELTSEHWDIIIEMIQVSLVFQDDDNGDYCYGEKETIVGKCIEFRLTSELAVDDLVTMHIKLKIQNQHLYFNNIPFVKKRSNRRSLLEMYVKELESLQQANNLCDYEGNELSDSGLDCFVVDLVQRIYDFNVDPERNELEPILFASHPWLTSNFERIAKEAEKSLDKSCNEQMESTRSSRGYAKYNKGFQFWGLPNKYLKIIQWLRQEQNLNLDAFHGSDYFFEKMWLCLPNHATILHFLKTNPLHLTVNWSANLLKMLETKACTALMKTLKYWNYSTFVDQSINKCTELMNETLEVNDDGIKIETKIQRKCNAAQVLSVLKKPNDFLELVTEFYPPTNKVDVFAEKSGEDYKMKQTITASIVNVSAHLTFDAIKKFCVGDYMKLIVDTLYSRINRAPSAKSLDFLRPQITNVPVSLQKHVIRLYCSLSNTNDRLSALTSVLGSSNVTIRYVVFLEAFKLFRSSPSQDTWILLKTIIENTSEDDAYILKMIHSKPEVDRCPSNFVSPYIDACLALLQKLEPSKISNFIVCIQPFIHQIPAQMLDKIVTTHFGTDDTFNSLFCRGYLHCSSSKEILKQRLSKVWHIVNNLIESGWYRKAENGDHPTRYLVNQFILSLCNSIKDTSKAWLEITICQTLLTKFVALSATKYFLEILFLQLALIHLEVIEYKNTEKLRQYGKRLAKFIDSLVKTYDGDIIFIAMNTMIAMLKGYFSTEISANKYAVVELVDELLETSRTRQNQIFSINLLEGTNPKQEKIVKMLHKIEAIFSGSKDVTVQVYYAFSTN